MKTLKKSKIWSESENLILKEHYPFKGEEEVARMLNRTGGAVKAQAVKLGLKLIRGKPGVARKDWSGWTIKKWQGGTIYTKGDILIHEPPIM